MAAATKGNGGAAGVLGDVLDEVPTDRLKKLALDFVTAAGQRALSAATDRVDGLTGNLLEFAEHGAAKLSGGGDDGDGGNGSGGKGGGGKKTKVVNIVESIEVGVPITVAYNQWTQFQDFPKFTKKVETAEQESDEKITWKAGIFLSHRTWQSTILEQVPDELIVWRSKGEKGYADGAVTFHELAPNLTKILLVLEYHPQGLFERTGNLWRAQGRRTRLELKHFVRHVMTQTILDPDGVEGWRGEIHDGEVVKSHEDALNDEGEDGAGDYQDEDEGADYADENEGEDEGEDEDYDGDDVEDRDEDYDDDYEEDQDEDEDEEDRDEDDEDDGYDAFEGDDEQDEDYDSAPRSRRRAHAGSR